MSVNLEGELVVSEVDYLDLLRSSFGYAIATQE